MFGLLYLTVGGGGGGRSVWLIVPDSGGGGAEVFGLLYLTVGGGGGGGGEVFGLFRLKYMDLQGRLLVGLIPPGPTKSKWPTWWLLENVSVCA